MVLDPKLTKLVTGVAGVALHETQRVREHSGIGQLLIVGEAPTERGDGEEPLLGSIGRRLAGLLFLSYPGEYRRTCDRLNLLQDFPGYARMSTNVRWPGRAAEARADILREVFRGRHILLLGRRVARAFGHPRARFFTRWQEADGTTYGLVPPLLPRWVKPESEDRARRMLKQLLRDARRRS